MAELEEILTDSKEKTLDEEVNEVFPEVELIGDKDIADNLLNYDFDL